MQLDKVFEKGGLKAFISFIEKLKVLSIRFKEVKVILGHVDFNRYVVSLGKYQDIMESIREFYQPRQRPHILEALTRLNLETMYYEQYDSILDIGLLFLYNIPLHEHIEKIRGIP